MKRVSDYLDPMAHLGERNYSSVSPFFITLGFIILSELFASVIMKNPMIVGTYAIFIPTALIIYFSFRQGRKGGVVAAILTVLYYFYIVYTRHYRGDQLNSGIETTIILGTIYLILAEIIGWLKETIDQLIEREADERQRLEVILQQLPAGVLITDPSGKLLHQNRQIEEMIGFKFPEKYVFGKDVPFVKVKTNGKMITPARSPLAHVLSKGKAIHNKEYIIEKEDGSQTFLQISASPVRNRHGKIIAGAQTIADITHQKELEKQKDDFLSMASHELKTPLTSMKIFLDLQKKLLKEKKASKGLYYIERIEDQANRLKELTNDLLDVSRIQTGKLRLTEESFDLIEVVHDTIESLRGVTEKHRIIFEEKGKEMISGDRYRIYQVLVNLITNAIKYSPNGNKINIKVKKTKKEILVSVQDFGIGIKKPQQTKIFDRLYQVTDPEEKTFPGLGLGLYITKEIVERHKGKIWVESVYGKGSTFFFSLPLPPKKR